MFQSTRPRGRTRHNLLQNYNRHNVSIHASSREDATIQAPKSGWQYGFNPRVLAGGRDMSTANSKELLKFQSTRPRGRTRLILQKMFVAFISFNPRVLAGGRDTTRLIGGWSMIVSIHASSREDATSRLVNLPVSSSFQSTRPRGRTRHDYFTSCLPWPQFQSTRPRGRTRHVTGRTDTKRRVSIHASSREDATGSYLSLSWQSSFQSTRPRGRTRPLCNNIRQIKALFQSTRPRGRTRRLLTGATAVPPVSIHASSREDAT